MAATKVFAQKQLEFYKEKGVNPAAGCLPKSFN